MAASGLSVISHELALLNYYKDDKLSQILHDHFSYVNLIKITYMVAIYQKIISTAEKV